DRSNPGSFSSPDPMPASPPSPPKAEKGCGVDVGVPPPMPASPPIGVSVAERTPTVSEMPAVRDHTGADVKRLVEPVGGKQGEVRKLVEQLRAKRAELLQQASMLAEAENQLNALLGIRGDGQSVKSWTAPRTQLDPSTAGVERKLDALVQELAALRLL